ncbi:hypothetical protein OHA25_08425 [Nonomuraea sp. NBC_00507]|uniref:hypothetical protein n=1 Tax=Nonomuraea sp. NBC_00507 TaxID=2976002 RepID=UPI002E189B99
MTDPITCPECEGKRGQQLGPLFLACLFCGGRGWVGADNEPAEACQKPPPPPPTATDHKVWTDPYIAAAFPCRMCFGSKQVTHVDEDSGVLMTSTCPCSVEPAPGA